MRQWLERVLRPHYSNEVILSGRGKIAWITLCPNSVHEAFRCKQRSRRNMESCLLYTQRSCRSTYEGRQATFCTDVLHLEKSQNRQRLYAVTRVLITLKITGRNYDIRKEVILVMSLFLRHCNRDFCSSACLKVKLLRFLLRIVPNSVSSWSITVGTTVHRTSHRLISIPFRNSYTIVRSSHLS